MPLDDNREYLSLPNDSHPSDETIEEYSMGRMEGPALEKFEEHLLVCERCQDSVAAEDALREGIRAAALPSQTHKPPLFRFNPRLAWALALPGMAVLVLAASKLPVWRHASAPVAVVLQATRGTETSSVAAHRSIMLTVDLTDLPPLSEYRLEVVDSAGRSAFRANASARNNQLHTTLADGLPGGAYFARLYSPGGELLREFTLSVHP